LRILSWRRLPNGCGSELGRRLMASINTTWLLSDVSSDHVSCSFD
jgi:hypothetical protein